MSYDIYRQIIAPKKTEFFCYNSMNFQHLIVLIQYFVHFLWMKVNQKFHYADSTWGVTAGLKGFKRLALSWTDV